MSAFTLIELLILIACVAILLALVPCAPTHSRLKARRVNCANNLKQSALAFRLFANEHDNAFPWTLSTNQGGTLELTNSAGVFSHFASASNELVTPRILTCRADSSRVSVTTFAEFNNSNLSYFISPEARLDDNNALMSGDRNVIGGRGVSPHWRVVRKGDSMTWNEQLHKKAGNISLGDGSVLQVDSRGLNEKLKAGTNASIRLGIS